MSCLRPLWSFVVVVRLLGEMSSEGFADEARLFECTAVGEEEVDDEDEEAEVEEEETDEAEEAAKLAGLIPGGICTARAYAMP